MTSGAVVDLRIANADGSSFPALLARPAKVPAAAVVCVPSIFGVNDEARRYLRQYADAGYVALVYDPFWRTTPGPLSPTEDADRRIAMTRRDGFIVGEGVTDLRSAIGAVRSLDACNGKVAIAGYCFGGRYAYLAATQLDVDAAISYHGIRIGDSLAGAGPLRCPATFHFGDQDHSVPMSEVDAIRLALRDDPRAEICVYPGVGHSFTWRGYHLYDEAAAHVAEARALALLATLSR